MKSIVFLWAALSCAAAIAETRTEQSNGERPALPEIPAAPENGPRHWRGMHVAVMGDSLTDKFQTSKQRVWWQYLGAWLDWKVHPHAIPGNQWNAVVQQTDNAVEERDRGIEHKAIFVMAGTNDYAGNVPLGEWYEEAESEVPWWGKRQPAKVRRHSQDGKTFRGRILTDHYCAAPVCAPSRACILSGMYSHKNGVPSFSDIPKDIKTIGGYMRDAGYYTAHIGKWHLGMGEGPEPIDWNKRVAPGAKEVGFDYSWLMAATADRVPCVFLRNGTVVGLDPDDPIEIKYTSVAKSSSGKASNLAASQTGLGLPDKPEEGPLWPGEVTVRRTESRLRRTMKGMIE